jgi:plastocyanin
VTPKALFIPVLLSLAFLVAACGGGGGETTVTETTTTEEPSGAAEEPSGANASAPSGEAVRAEKVEIVGFSYDPDPVVIQEGGKVIWINKDKEPHTATADDGSFDTGPIEEGKLKSETFKEPGTYTYHCEIHPQMHGTVEVVESG